MSDDCVLYEERIAVTRKVPVLGAHADAAKATLSRPVYAGGLGRFECIPSPSLEQTAYLLGALVAALSGFIEVDRAR